MMKNRLIHYTDEKFELDRNKSYKENNFKSKPGAFWFSVEGEYDWKWWCKAENFRLDYLKIQYEVILKKDAKILVLDDADEVIKFTEENLYPKARFKDDTYELDWEKISKKYQGIIISPYQWGLRLSIKTGWYYGWDCASGCIWDLNAIEELKFIQEETITEETIMREQIINEVNATKQALSDLEETAKKFVEKDKNTCTFFGKLMEFKNEIIKKSSESKSTEVKEELNIIVERLEEFFRITGEK